MIRLFLAGLAGYALYRMGQRFVRSVPEDFEPVGPWPGDSESRLPRRVPELDRR